MRVSQKILVEQTQIHEEQTQIHRDVLYTEENISAQVLDFCGPTEHCPGSQHHALLAHADIHRSREHVYYQPKPLTLKLLHTVPIGAAPGLGSSDHPSS